MQPRHTSLFLLLALTVAPMTATGDGYYTHEPLNQSGRAWFVLSTAAKSALIAPTVIDGTLGKLARSKYTGVSLLASGGSLYAGYMMSADMELGYGKVTLMNYGGTLGLLYPHQAAMLIHHATDLDKDYREAGPIDDNDPLPSERIQAWATLLMYPYGVYAAGSSELVANDDFGAATVVTYFSQTFGLAGYILPMYWLDPWDEKDRDAYYRASPSLTMLLIPIGAYYGAKIADEMDVSSGRGILTYLAGAMGTGSMLLLTNLTNPDRYLDGEKSIRKAYVSAGLAGYVLGSAIGLNYKPERDFTVLQTIVTGASAAAGGAIGLGIPYVLEADSDRSYAAGLLIGSWIGLGVGARITSTLTERVSPDLSGLPGGERLSISLDGLVGMPLMLLGSKRRSAKSSFSMPIGQVQYRF